MWIGLIMWKVLGMERAGGIHELMQIINKLMQKLKRTKMEKKVEVEEEVW